MSLEARWDVPIGFSVLFFLTQRKFILFFPFQLALKHRQGKNHKMRIIAFVGSPVEDTDKEVSGILT